jgi:hypothetical protein
VLRGRVHHVDLNLSAVAADGDVHRRAWRMFESVGEGFLDDAVGGLGRGRAQLVAATEEPAGHDEAGDAGPADKLVDHRQPRR